jgi:DNA polymerase III subunit delta
MSFDQLKKDLKSGLTYPLYLLHGEESYLIDEVEEHLERHLLQEHEKPFDQQILYGMDCNARYVIEQLQLFPMIASRRVVFVREAQQMEDLKDMESYFNRPAPGSILVLCHKGKSMDKRLKAYDGIKKNGFIFAADKLKDKDVLPWLLKTASELKLKIDADAGEAMIELIGEEVSLLHPELLKLAINHAGGAAITKADIVDLIGLSREYNVFELQNALESGNVVKTLHIGSRMAEQKGYSIIPLIALLYGFYSRAYTIKSMGSATDAAIGEAIGNKSPYFINRNKDAARRYSLETLEKCIGWLHIYDMKSKGWGYTGGDDRALTIELLDRLLFPDNFPVFAES